MSRPPRRGGMIVVASAVRAAFGIIWAIDAYLTWRGEFAAHYVGYLQNAARGQPAWLEGWFRFWIAVVTPYADVFIWITRILETLIALGLVLGIARRWVYVVGIAFSALIWATADGFGGPYTAGAANVGPALVYVLVFVALIVFDRVLGRTPYGVDFYLERRWPWWRGMAEWGTREVLLETPPRLGWGAQALAIVGLAALLAFFLGTLQSALTTEPPTPSRAAAAVSPLSLAGEAPTSGARDARLPPLLGPGETIPLTLKATDVNVEIANGVFYQAWTFGGMVPAPVLHVRQGQRLDVTFVNEGHMQHSIDFHAAEVAPNVAYRSVDPGESVHFTFTARVPGAFIYHCGTPPVLQHIANGMYGVIVVDPRVPLPPADVSYVLTQSEWYTQQVQGSLMAGDMGKMTAAAPDEVVFNGRAFQYVQRPLPAKVGKRVRIYFVNAGPSLGSAFHVIGGIFDAVYPDGDARHALTGVSTYHVPPGAGAVFDVILAEPGRYPFVDHSMRAQLIGATGVLDAQP